MSAKLAWLVLFAVSLSAQQRPASPLVAQHYRISGTVVNSLTGQPIPSASVAIAPTTQGMERDISKSFLTGPDGRFSFIDLTRGKYSLMAAARGFSLQYFEHHDPYATAVAVGPDLDAEHLVFRLDPDASIEGQVTDENDDPVQNAMVRLFQASTEGGEQQTLPINQVQTDDQGTLSDRAPCRRASITWRFRRGPGMRRACARCPERATRTPIRKRRRTLQRSTSPIL